MNRQDNQNERGVRFEAKGPVAHIVLDRPEASNAFDIPAALALRSALDEASTDSYRALLIRGEGDRFCAGGDVSSFRDSSTKSRPAYLAKLAGLLDKEIRRFGYLGKPVITVAHGAVAGAGLAFVLNADITIAARSTKFVFAYPGIGLTPDCGVSYQLPRAIGVQRALDMAVGGRVIGAPEAESWGLITRVTEDDRALMEAEDLATKLAEGPTFALAQTARLLRGAWDTQRDAHSADEIRTIASAVTTPPAMDLIREFLDR